MDQRTGETSEDCVARACALAPLIGAAAPRIEAERGLPADLVDALHQARLFHLLVPRSLGGGEVSPVAFMAAIEAIAMADASTAWCIAQTSICSTVAKALPRPLAERMFLDDPRGVLAWGPSHTLPRATAVPGGYRVSGVWPFASGSRQATWLAAHCRIHEADGTPRHGADGAPLEKTLLVPKREARIDDVWHVIGLKGTGSDTYTLSDVFVPAEHAIAYHALDPAEFREHGPLFAFNIYQLFGGAFPAVALGIARALLDAFLDLAGKKGAAHTSALLRDNPVIQAQVGVAEAQLAAARLFFYATWEEAWATVQNGALSLEQRVRLRMASIHLSQQARQVADTAYHAAGAGAVLASNPFERRFRDMHAVSQQAQSQLSIFETIGRYYLGLSPSPRLV